MCPGYDTKQSDGEAPVMLELWGMQSISSLPLFPCVHCPGVIVPDRVLSMGQIELFDHLTVCKLCLIELLGMHCNTWTYLAVCKQISNVELNK